MNLKLWSYRYESKILLNIDQRNCASDIHNKLQCNSSIVFVTNPDPIVSLLPIPLLPVISMKFLQNVLPEKSNYLQPNDNKINGVVARLVMAYMENIFFKNVKCCSSCCLLWKNNIIYIFTSRKLQNIKHSTFFGNAFRKWHILCTDPNFMLWQNKLPAIWKKLRNIIVHSNELITLTVPELWPFSGNNYTNMLHVLNQRGLVKIEIMAIETSVEKKRYCGTYNSGFFL